MWLQEELLALQVDNLSIRQQLDLLQDNAYVRCNLNNLTNTGVISTLAIKEETAIKVHPSRYVHEANIAWNNILSYFCLAFPEVWKAICDSNILPGNTTNPKACIRLQDINIGIQSCKKVLEVFKTLVYGGSLRPHFSRNHHIQQLYLNLLSSCQSSDISGKDHISGQYRIIFLQNWIEKLVNNSSLPSFFNNSISLSSPRILSSKQSAFDLETKYIVSKIPDSKPSSSYDKSKAGLTSSSQTVHTTFSAYINKFHTQSSKFVGIKTKFDSDSSVDSNSTETSDNSIWEPTFKKRKAL